MHDVYAIRNRTKALRRLATLVAATLGCGMETFSDTKSPHHKLWSRVTNLLTLRTVTSPPIQNLDVLSLAHTLPKRRTTTQCHPNSKVDSVPALGHTNE